MKIPIVLIVPMTIYDTISSVAFERLEMLRGSAQENPLDSLEAEELERLELWADWESEQYERGVLPTIWT